MGALEETIYDAAADPDRWADVGELLRAEFQSSVEALYLLTYDRGLFQEMHVAGVESGYYSSFPAHFFSSDNPFVRSPPLHRPGVVRTDTMVQAYFRDPHVVRRSRYYNEWLHPQDLAHTLGTTLDSEAGSVANLSLLRPAALGPFRAREVARFTDLVEHLRRALRVSRRLETLAARERAGLEALEALSHGVLFLDLAGRPLFANAVAEEILRRGDTLTLSHGRLSAVDARDQGRIDGLLRQLAQGPVSAPERASFAVGGERELLQLVAIRLSAMQGRLPGAGPCLLVLLLDPAARRQGLVQAWRQRYGLTRVEAGLAEALAAGESLRQAADRLGLSYETARWYLKVVFQKTETSRQAELVARLLSDVAVAPL